LVSKLKYNISRPGRKPMRTIILAVTVGLLTGYATAAFAAQAPTIAACESLADKRGSGFGTGAGTGVHRTFMQACLAGRVSFVDASAPPVAVSEPPTTAECEDLAAKRGSAAGTGVGTGAHKAFIASCLAGRVSFVSDVKPPTAKQKLQAQSYDKCEALAEERGSTIEERKGFLSFISQCMAGKIH
jgi:hypothetical protein